MTQRKPKPKPKPIRVRSVKQVTHLPRHLRDRIAYLLHIRAWFYITHEGQAYSPTRKARRNE